MVHGSPTDLGADGVLVYENEADDLGVKVGDTLPVQFLSGSPPLDLRVAGIYRHEDFVGGFPVPFIVSRGLYETQFGPQQQAQVVYARSKSPGDVQATGTELRKALHHDFPNV